ncbi:MAG: hypothetical protein V3S87_12445, partial [Alphaproteobacteria bacterium]
MVDLKDISLDELKVMAAMARDVMACHRVLAKTGDNIVGEALRDAGTFLEFDHYPPGDVYDRES